ncbi:UDP-glucose 4-epimerase [Neorhodopirellula lusitana]|uniref:UDP-glucose 4-epimerase n=1 Tax=Neorhodopirellula lusitana TaxID=445327 RepID=A0ABY1PY72_9BACT|nr:UDP-glucose 4-epimerase GalE [Neorhodopirellula lusitana]SMP50459.1 UDP-glucose 4-epimerase [Neorhodopirellula lusitana]
MKILVTGGAGYIGSHTCLELLEAGHELTAIDDLSNSSKESLRRVEKLTGKKVDLRCFSLLDGEQTLAVLKEVQPDAVIHFAAMKAVGESVEYPLRYYKNNVSGTINLIEAMQTAGCKNLVYSSSCTVYGEPTKLPLTEDHPTATAESPYGWTKLMTEQIMRDVHVSDSSMNFTLLRYFNPVGAHASGDIGEDPNGIPNNLLPFITQVAVGKLAKLNIFGDDYETRDGTCIRDYIHVVDLAKAHVSAVEQVVAKQPGVVTYNLGTGTGSTVLEMVHAFEAASGKKLPYEIAPRRAGDIVAAYADPTKAKEELGWATTLDVNDMCRDSWRWQSQNPNGYEAS